MSTNKLSKKTILGIKLEAVQGTTNTPAAADYLNVQDVNIKPNNDKLIRDYSRQSLGPLPHMIGKQSGEVSFKAELKGSGAAGTFSPTLSAILVSCGLSASSAVIMKPSSNAMSTNFYGPGRSVTILVWKDGIQHILAGCLGSSLKITADAGKIPMLEVTYKGLWQDPTDVASAPSNSPDKRLPPIVQNANLTVQGYSGITSKFSLDFGTTVTDIDDISSSAGLLGFQITGYDPKATYEPLVPTVAAENAFNKLRLGTTGTLTATIGYDPGNKFIISCPCIQYDDVSYADDGGLLRFSLPLKINDDILDDFISLSAG